MHVRSLLVVLSAASPLLSQTLLKDFNTTPYPEAASSAATPVGITQAGNLLVVAFAPGTGRELWVSDGTQVGTQLLADLHPGYQSSVPVQFVTLPSGLILFTARTPLYGWELWRTDGTTVGTNLVKDILPGVVGSVAVNLTVVGNEAVFFADDGVHGTEPWKSDGTTIGTVMVADTNPFGGMSNGAVDVVPMGTGQFVFSAQHANWELWLSDGTAAGTSKIIGFPGSLSTYQPGHLTTFGSRVLFDARDAGGYGAWVTDGTAAGTFGLGSGTYSDFLVVGSTAYFGGDGYELWHTDGTLAGTQLAVDVTPGAGSISRPALLGSIGSDVIFSAYNGNGLDRDLFVSDGTSAGTSSIGTVGTYIYHLANGGARIGGSIYFQGTDQAFPATWRTDGTAAGTVMLTGAPGDSFVEWNGNAFFRASETATGRELWSSDGTPGGTQLLADINDIQRTLDSFVALLTPIRDEVALLADDGVMGRQIWLTDGTTAGTRPVTSFVGGLQSAAATSTDSFLWASITGVGFSDDPWVSDSAGAGFQQLQVSATYPGFRMFGATAAGSQIVFAGTTTANGTEPWITDGTLLGTRAIADLVPGAGSSYARSFWHWRGKTFFLASTPVGSGVEPWVTDGTAAGTFQLAEMVPGSNGVANIGFAAAGDLVFFSASYPADQELWITNGTVAGTYMLDLEPGPNGSNPVGMTPIGDRVLFAATLNGTQRVVVSDGTLSGTLALQPFGVLRSIRRLSASEAVVFVDDSGQSVAWRTDGTAAGTQLIGPMQVYSHYSTSMANPTDDKLMLELVDPVVGRELFVTDGTVSGTQLLLDLGLENASPSQVMRAGTRLIVVADDGIHGRELHGVDLALLQDETVARVGFGCAGTGGHVPTLSVVGEVDASSTASFDLIVEGALAFAPVVIALGTDSGAQPLSACTVFAGGTLTFASLTADGVGSARLSLQLNPALVGMRFVAQAFPIDIGGPVLGLASATAGLELIIGP